MSTTNIWAAIDVAFAAIIRVIQNKSAGNWQAAAIALEECNASLVEATRQFQALTTNLRNQREHTEAVSLNRVLQSYLVPLISALMECMQSSGTLAPIPPAAGPERPPWLSPQLLAAIDEQLRALAHNPGALAKLGELLAPLARLNEINIIRACELLASDNEMGVAFVIRLLRELRTERRDLLPYLAAYLQEIGTLSNDASTVATNGIRISIGDIGSTHARILLAVRYLEIKENFRL